MLLYLISFLLYINMLFFHLSSQGISLSPERGLGWTSRTFFLNRPTFHLNMCSFKWPCSTSILNPFSLLSQAMKKSSFTNVAKSFTYFIPHHGTYTFWGKLTQPFTGVIYDFFTMIRMLSYDSGRSTKGFGDFKQQNCITVYCAAQFSWCEKENRDLDKLRAKQKRQYHCVINGI